MQGPGQSFQQAVKGLMAAILFSALMSGASDWEVEAQNGQSVSQIQSSLSEAGRAGKVRPVPIDEATWEFTYWEPMTPYITKEDFVR
jgi:hypothetical protein